MPILNSQDFDELLKATGYQPPLGPAGGPCINQIDCYGLKLRRDLFGAIPQGCVFDERKKEICVKPWAEWLEDEQADSERRRFELCRSMADLARYIGIPELEL